MYFKNKKAEGSVDISIKLIISVTLAAIILVGSFFMINGYVAPGMLKAFNQQNKFKEVSSDNEENPSTESDVNPLNHSDTIHEGGNYYSEFSGWGDCICGQSNFIDSPGGTCETCHDTFTSPTAEAGESFPTLADGDVYTYGNYSYTYSSSSDGWEVKVYNKTITSYGLILESINNKPVISMENTFAEVYSQLETAPVIPNGVTNMENTFCNCPLLTVPPVIPNSVTVMSKYTFVACTGLVGQTITIPANCDMNGTSSGLGGDSGTFSSGPNWIRAAS